MTARDVLLCSVQSYHRLTRVCTARIMGIAQPRPRLPHCVPLHVGRISPWAQRSSKGHECFRHPYSVPDLRRPQLGKERLRKYAQMAHGHIIICFRPRPICGHGVWLPSPHHVQLSPPNGCQSELITLVLELWLSPTNISKRTEVTFKWDSHKVVSISATSISTQRG